MYDLSLSEWYDSEDRRIKGMAFPRGFFDASIILVQKKKIEKENFDILSFMDPFTSDVWWMMFGTLLFSSWLTYVLQKLSGRHAAGNVTWQCLHTQKTKKTNSCGTTGLTTLPFIHRKASQRG
jgi:hypothetical protein